VSGRAPRRRRAVARSEDALSASPRRDRPPPLKETESGSGNRLSLGTWIALLAGAQIGRASVALPEGLSDAAGIVVALGLAVTVTMAYRRWARRAMASARSRRSER